MASLWGREEKQRLCFHSSSGEIQVLVLSSSIRFLCGGVEITFHIQQNDIHICVGVHKYLKKCLEQCSFVCAVFVGFFFSSLELCCSVICKPRVLCCLPTL